MTNTMYTPLDQAEINPTLTSLELPDFTQATTQWKHIFEGIDKLVAILTIMDEKLVEKLDCFRSEAGLRMEHRYLGEGILYHLSTAFDDLSIAFNNHKDLYTPLMDYVQEQLEEKAQ